LKACFYQINGENTCDTNNAGNRAIDNARHQTEMRRNIVKMKMAPGKTIVFFFFLCSEYWKRANLLQLCISWHPWLVLKFRYLCGRTWRMHKAQARECSW
jgi:hypothetical protein